MIEKMEDTFIKTDKGNYVNAKMISVVYTDKEPDCFYLREMLGYHPNFGVVCKHTRPESYEQIKNLVGMK